MHDLLDRLAELDRRVVGAATSVAERRPPVWSELDRVTRSEHARWLLARLPAVLVASALLALLGATAGTDVATVGLAAVLVPLGTLRVAYAHRFAEERDGR